MSSIEQPDAPAVARARSEAAADEERSPSRRWPEPVAPPRASAAAAITSVAQEPQVRPFDHSAALLEAPALDELALRGLLEAARVIALRTSAIADETRRSDAFAGRRPIDRQRQRSSVAARRRGAIRPGRRRGV